MWARREVRLHIMVSIKFLGKKLSCSVQLLLLKLGAPGTKGLVSWHRWQFICPDSWAISPLDLFYERSSKRVKEQ